MNRGFGGPSRLDIGGGGGRGRGYAPPPGRLGGPQTMGRYGDSLTGGQRGGRRGGPQRGFFDMTTPVSPPRRPGVPGWRTLARRLWAWYEWPLGWAEQGGSSGWTIPAGWTKCATPSCEGSADYYVLTQSFQNCAPALGTCPEAQVLQSINGCIANVYSSYCVPPPEFGFIHYDKLTVAELTSGTIGTADARYKVHAQFIRPVADTTNKPTIAGGYVTPLPIARPPFSWPVLVPMPEVVHENKPVPYVPGYVVLEPEMGPEVVLEPAVDPRVSGDPRIYPGTRVVPDRRPYVPPYTPRVLYPGDPVVRPGVVTDPRIDQPPVVPPVVVPGVDVPRPGVVREVKSPRPHLLVPDRKKKVKMPGWLFRLLKFYHAASEFGDAMDCAYEQVKGQPGAGGPVTFLDKVLLVIEHQDKIDMLGLANCIRANDAEDRVVGDFMRQLGENFERAGGPRATGITQPGRTMQNMR